MSSQPSSLSTTYGATFYAQQANGSLQSARVILPILLSHISPLSVIDVGCGIGTWLKAFQECGVTDVTGYDGDYVDQRALLIDPAQFRPADLKDDQPFDRTYDLAISLEVAEHLPQQHAGSFVRRLTSAAPAVLFSAAIPGQGGTSHLNEQWQDYWRELFSDEGFLPVDIIRAQVHGRPDVETWYQSNIMLYCSTEFLAGHQNLSPVDPNRTLNQVHWALYNDANVLYLTKVLKIFQVSRGARLRVASDDGAECPSGDFRQATDTDHCGGMRAVDNFSLQSAVPETEGVRMQPDSRKQVRVTVAICTLNHAELLRRTLNSLAEMSVPQDLIWEVVVVNNNCTDHTDTVIEAFADQLPIRREYEVNRGLSLARNRAIECARGNYIAWTDDDVIADPGWLAAYADAFRRWPEAVIFGGPIVPKYVSPLPELFADAEPFLSSWVFWRRDVDDEGEITLSSNVVPVGANFRTACG